MLEGFAVLLVPATQLTATTDQTSPETQKANAVCCTLMLAKSTRQSCWLETVPREEGHVHQGCSLEWQHCRQIAPAAPRLRGTSRDPPGAPHSPLTCCPPSSSALDQPPNPGTKLISHLVITWQGETPLGLGTPHQAATPGITTATFIRVHPAEPHGSTAPPCASIQRQTLTSLLFRVAMCGVALYVKPEQHREKLFSGKHKR